MPLVLYINKIDGRLYKRRGDYAVRDDGTSMKIDDSEAFRKIMVEIKDVKRAYAFIGEELRENGISLDRLS